MEIEYKLSYFETPKRKVLIEKNNPSWLDAYFDTTFSVDINALFLQQVALQTIMKDNMFSSVGIPSHLIKPSNENSAD